MSRSGYDDSGDYNYELYRNAVDRAFRGKRGQAFLREMLAAMDAMPEKRLMAYGFEAAGEVCALGTVTKARGIDMSDVDRLIEDEEEGWRIGAIAGRRLGIAQSMAREIMYMNDEAYGRRVDETPEQRFARMRAWIERQLIEWEATL